MTKDRTAMEYQKAIDFVFQMIREGKLIVGSKLPSERDIAETLGIGRNSIREAISILRGMGLIESRHGSGNYIAKDSGRTIWQIVSVMLALGSISMKDILEFRRVMERSVIELIFANGIDEEEKAHLEAITDRMNAASGKQFVKLDLEFHITLIRAAKNPLLMVILEAIAEGYHESMSKVIEESDEETTKRFTMLHRNIFHSIAQGDEAACLKYMKEHYALSESKL